MLGPGSYVGLPPLNTVEEIVAWLQDNGIAHEVLGHNFAGQPLPLIRTGGGTGRPLVITAGAHAGEPAGVLAALLLARDQVFERPTYIVPLRDPFAWQGFWRALGRVDLEREDGGDLDNAAAAGILAAAGKVVHDDGRLLVADVNGVFFATMPPSDPPIGPRQLEQAVNDALAADPLLVKQMIGRRVVFPSNAGPAEGVGDHQRAFSATVRSPGIVADMNRGFGGPEEPAEVALLRQLVDGLDPGLVLDLHEGQGTSYYVFVGAGSPHADTTRFAVAALEAMGAEGQPAVTLADLERAFGPRIREGLSEPVPGMMVGRVQHTRLEGTSFGNYCDRYCPAITLETGRWARLADRVRWQLAGARAVLDAYMSG